MHPMDPTGEVAGGLVLVLEDEPSMRQLLVVALQRAGHEILEHASGEAALVALDTRPVELVLLDLSLPGMSGYEVLARIRASRSPLELPVLVVTASERHAALRQAFDAGASDYLAKPIDVDVLLVRVRTHLALRRAAAELAGARIAAEAADQAKSAFLRAMSHEIRTPMNLLLGMSEALSETPLNPKQHELLHMIRRSGETLNSLIDQVLELAHSGSGDGEADRQEVDLLELVEHVVEGLIDSAHRKGLALFCRFDPDVPARVMGDPRRLRQVLLHLVGNSLKFTDAGDVVLEVTRGPPEANLATLTFSVIDTGIGIPGEAQERIFEAFTQVDDSMTRRHGGAGLGLAISRRLVDQMGGALVVASEPGRGSRFSFTLTAAVPAGSTRVANAIPDLQGLELLVAESRAEVARELGPLVTVRGGTLRSVDSIDALERELEATRRSGRTHPAILIEQDLDTARARKLAQGLLASRDPVGTPVLLVGTRSDPTSFDGLEQRGLRWLTRPVRLRALGRFLAQVLDLEHGEDPESCQLPFVARLPDDRPLFILLVEDSPDNRRLIETYVNGTMIRLDIAENGAIAVERFGKHSYDLVLMDIAMPVMDGLQATRLIRQWERDHRQVPTPILALSAHTAPENAQRAREAGCDDYLTKPISRSALLGAIAQKLAGPEGTPVTPPAPTPAEPPPGPVVEDFLVEVGEDFRPLVTDYLARRIQDVTLLREAMSVGDLARVKSMGHNMKGTGTAYGMQRISEIGAEIETAAGQAQRPRLEELVASLERYVTQVKLR